MVPHILARTPFFFIPELRASFTFKNFYSRTVKMRIFTLSYDNQICGLRRIFITIEKIMNRGQTLTSLLNSIRGNRGGTIPKTILNQMEKLIVARNIPVHHYEILNIYNHLSFNKDEQAFSRLDPLFFPPRGTKEGIEPSLKIAYRRLYCLIKYEMPYITWVKKVRELLHESSISSTDMKFLFSLGSSQSLIGNDEYSELLNDFQCIFLEEVQKIDLLTMIALRKYFSRNKLKNRNLGEVRARIDAEVDSELSYFTASQLKFMLQTKRISANQLFYCLFKFHHLPKKFSFFLLLQSSKIQWTEWAKENLNRQEILDKLPSNDMEFKPIAIAQNIYGQYIVQRPYIDEYFEFVQVGEGEKAEWRLKNAQLNYTTFLINAIYYFYPGVQAPEYAAYDKIKQVLSQTYYLLKNPILVVLFFSVRHSIIINSKLEQQEKEKQETQLVVETHDLFKRCERVSPQVMKSPLLLPTNSYRNMGTLEFPVYRIPEFGFVMERLTSICKETSNQVLSGWLSAEFLQIQKVVHQYMGSHRQPENSMFFGELRRVPMREDSKLEVFVAKNVEVNQTVSVQYLVKVRNKDTKNEQKCLVDLSYVESTPSSTQVSVGKLWKTNYLSRWCGLNYQVLSYTGQQEYPKSPDLLQHLHLMFKSQY